MTRPDPAPAPGCYVVHPGQPAPDDQQRARLAAWLTANHIDPERVPLDQPILVLTVPSIRGVTTPRDEDWRFQVIVLTEFYVNADGQREANLVTGRPVTLQRTVPLTCPFPTTEEVTDGSTTEVQPVEEDQRPAQHQERTQGDEQQELRPAAQEEVQDRRSPSRQERTRQGVAAWIAGGEEAGAKGRGGQVSEPQEEADRRPGPQEEVGGTS